MSNSDYGQDLTITLKSRTANGLRGAETVDAHGCIGNVSVAQLYVFGATGKRNRRAAALICPGGGFRIVSVDHEGIGVALWLASQGITAAVLKYRLPNSHSNIPFDDVAQALCELKVLDKRFDFDRGRIGIIGFSAGGLLAATAANRPENELKFCALFYPVVSSRADLRHRGTYEHLLGEHFDDHDAAYFDTDRQVLPSTPPTTIFLSADDCSVPPDNSCLYCDALRRHGVECDIKIYPLGGHGWGFTPSSPNFDECRHSFEQWLNRILD